MLWPSQTLRTTQNITWEGKNSFKHTLNGSVTQLIALFPAPLKYK